jgi:hypothetical protein
MKEGRRKDEGRNERLKDGRKGKERKGKVR